MSRTDNKKQQVEAADGCRVGGKEIFIDELWTLLLCYIKGCIKRWEVLPPLHLQAAATSYNS